MPIRRPENRPSTPRPPAAREATPRALARRVAALSSAAVIAPAGFSGLSSFVGFAPRALVQPPLSCAEPARQATPRPTVFGDSDGLLHGGDGQMYNARTTSIQDVPPVMPSDPSMRTGERTLYVNGAWTTVDGARADMQLIADATGNDVVGVVNATGGWSTAQETARDALQAAGDKLGVGPNAAKDTVANVLCRAVAARRNLTVVGQSQGAAIVGRALFEVDAHLTRKQGAFVDVTGQARAARAEALSVLDVRTTGGVGHAFPDGPRYLHMQNTSDGLTAALGVGNPVLEAVGLVRPGAGAERATFSHPGPSSYPGYLAPHVLETYALHMAPEPSSGPDRTDKAVAPASVGVRPAKPTVDGG